MKRFLRISVHSFSSLFFFPLLLLLFWGCVHNASEIYPGEDGPANLTAEKGVLTGVVTDVNPDRKNFSLLVKTAGHSEKLPIRYSSGTTGQDLLSEGQTLSIWFAMKNGSRYARAIRASRQRLPVGVTVVSPAQVHDIIQAASDSVLVDCRDFSRYATGHLRGALSMPYEKILSGSIDFRSMHNAKLILYGESPTCPLSLQAATLAREQGCRSVQVMTAGVQGFVNKGFPLYGDRSLLTRQDVITIDLRPTEAAAILRFPNAVSLPFSQLEWKIKEIPAKAVILLSSDDQEEVIQGYALLRQHGLRKVSIAEISLKEWGDSGGKTASGNPLTTIKWHKKLLPNELSIEDFQKELQARGNNIVLLDVRTPEETAAGTFKNALSVPFMELQAKTNALPKNKKIVIYSSRGARAELASTLLERQGFKSVFLDATVTCSKGSCRATP